MIRTPALVLILALIVSACRTDPPPGPASRSPRAVRAGEAATPAAPLPASQATAPSTALSPAVSQFAGSVSEVDASRLPFSWRPGCPVGPADLRLLTVAHWGFDGQVKTGQLVVHAEHAADVLQVLRRLFELRFPIEKMELIDNYRGDDDLSVAANNTSAFNCRPVTGRDGVWSQHAYGWAIDINPVQNPFISSGRVSPPSAESYRDRSHPRPGMIRAEDEVVDAFASIGWEWGGYWNNPKDYQHFSRTGR